MVRYLARKYLEIVLVVATMLVLMPVVFGAVWHEVLLSALVWGGLAAAPLTYWEFRRHQLWPLYDNLRLPRWGLLAVLVGGVESLVLLAMLGLRL